MDGGKEFLKDVEKKWFKEEEVNYLFSKVQISKCQGK